MAAICLIIAAIFFINGSIAFLNNGATIRQNVDQDIFKGLVQIAPAGPSYNNFNVRKPGFPHFSRKKRFVSNTVKINFINKSGRIVRVFAAETTRYHYYYKRQFDLRPNEPKGVTVWPGAVWIAKDIETGITMLINGKTSYVVKAARDQTAFSDLKIRNPSVLKRKIQLDDHRTIPEKYLRVMIVADASVTNNYGKNYVKKYLMTLMNIVSKTFKDKSLGVKIRIIITKIHIWENDPASYKITENDPDASISNACNVASSLDKEHKHNFVVVLTRKSIGPSGYAAMYTMCTKHSCTLVKESGFTTAYVIAHETGHALGIDHDGEDQECENDKIRGSIMAPKVYSKHEQYHWSKCSKRTLYENIEYFTCLNKKPTRYETNEINEFVDMPGEMLSKSEQCKHRLGRQASACYVYYGACSFLWCRRGFWASCQALVLASPLEGTFCGTKKWCVKGKCVTNHVQAVNGQWSNWNDASKCTGYCGAGVQIRQRKCDNPAPQYGGRLCVGKNYQLIPCKLKKCNSVESKRDIKKNKCKLLGDSWNFYDIKEAETKLKDANISCNFESGACGWKNDVTDRLDWVTHSGPTRSSETGPDSHYVYFETSWLKANLRPMQGDTARLVSPIVTAPTVCFSFYYHMFGQHVGSLKVSTSSSVKAGDALWNMEGSQGNKWKKVELTIKNNNPFQVVFEAVRGNGYRGDIAIDDVEIRLGSCSEKVVVSPCSGYCFSRKEDSFRQVSFENGTPCHLNRSFDICYEGKCQNIGCDYQLGSGKEIDECGNCGGEGNSCKLVKTKKIVKSERLVQDVFMLPAGSENIKITIKGRSRLFGGIRLDDRNSTNVFNSDGWRWPSGNYSIHKNNIVYDRNDKIETIKINKLVDHGCRVVIFNPFASDASVGLFAEVAIDATLPVSKGHNQFKYTIESWTGCSKKCDGGVQHPIPACFEKKTGRKVSDLYCSDIISPDVELSRSCNNQRCLQRYRWHSEAWSSCTKTCGPGRQTRKVGCLDNDLRVFVNENACQGPRPVKQQYCYSRPCNGFRLITEKWSKCSKSCGKGVQRRRVICATDNNALLHLPLAACPGEFPVTARFCNVNICNVYDWVSYYYGHCSATCGGGVQIQIITCKHLKTGVTVYDYLCPQPKPFPIVSCNVSPC
eukprot:gene12677-13978_t